MKRRFAERFFASWPQPGVWYVSGGRYYPLHPHQVIRLRQLPGGRLELCP